MTISNSKQFLESRKWNRLLQYDMSICKTWEICCLVTSNQTQDVFVYLIILCTCLSPGHNKVSKTDKSPNPYKAFDLLG